MHRDDDGGGDLLLHQRWSSGLRLVWRILRSVT
jgi:hypothetical protein